VMTHFLCGLAAASLSEQKITSMSILAKKLRHGGFK